MFKSLKSILSALSIFAAVFAVTTTGAVVGAAPAEAGVLSSIKGAAKAVGRGVETGVKAVGRGAATMGRGVARDTVKLAKGVANSPLGDIAKRFGKDVKSAGRVVNRYVLHRK